MIDIEQIIKKAEKYNVITFDVFDTLLIRDVLKPTDLFTLSYGTFGRYIRIISEHVARKYKKNGEVTLNDIEKKCPFSCKKEVELEKQYLRANPKIQEVYNRLKALGKKMYAISDMYLSSDQIGELLRSSGYDLPVIVSCEEGCNKRSGDLFRRFLEKENFSGEQILHIGDNNDADGIGAEKAGITSIVIEKHSNVLAYIKYSKRTPELTSFINHGLNEIDDPVERIGYEVVGPIILRFCQWIHKKNKEYGFDRLYFLARDMRFSYETYRKLYPEDDVRYLCVSRKSLKKAEENPESFCEYIKKEGCYGNVSIVDTGWVGGMQLTIEKYARMIDKRTDLGGLYLCVKLAYRKLNRSPRSEVCLYPTLYGQFKCQLFPPFMETLIGCNEKQVIEYFDGEPIFDREESRDQTYKIKSGASAFISDWFSKKNNKPLTNIAVTKPYERMFYFPRNEDISLIGDLHYEDFKDTKIVSFDDRCPYWRRPMKFMADLSDSGWKGAFIKKLHLFKQIVFLLYFTFGPIRLYFQDLKKSQ